MSLLPPQMSRTTLLAILLGNTMLAAGAFAQSACTPDATGAYICVGSGTGLVDRDLNYARITIRPGAEIFDGNDRAFRLGDGLVLENNGRVEATDEHAVQAFENAQVINNGTLVSGDGDGVNLETDDEGLRNPNQVYRALDKLMEYGLVHRLESLNAFVACAHPDDHAHAHGHGMIAFAICEACGQAEEFSDAAIGERLTGWSKDHAFNLSRAIIEMRGTCESCASAQAKSGPSA